MIVVVQLPVCSSNHRKQDDSYIRDGSLGYWIHAGTAGDGKID